MVSAAVSTLSLLALCLGASALPRFTQDLTVPGVQSSISYGKCPESEKPSKDFDLKKYLGLWYEIRRTGLIFEFGQKCVTAEYSLKEDETVLVNNTGTTFLGDYDISVPGVGTPRNQSNVLGVKFFPLSPEANYWIVDTDFKTYSLVLSCNDVLGLFNIKDAWILSRTKTLEAPIQERLLKKLETLGVPRCLLKATEQINC